MRSKLATVMVIALAGMGVAGCGAEGESVISSGANKVATAASNAQLCASLQTETAKVSKDLAQVASAAVGADNAAAVSETLVKISESGNQAFTKLAGMDFSPEAKALFTKFAALYAALTGDDLTALNAFAQEAESLGTALTAETKKVCSIQ